MRILAHPMTLSGGRLATVESDSPAGTAQQIATILLTRPWERPLAPSFGVTDPAFRGVSLAEANAALSVHLPQTRIVSLGTVPVDSRTEKLIVSFTGADNAG